MGLACAERFRADGAEVVVLDLAHPDNPVDTTDHNAVEAAFAALPRTPDVLVNAAGIGAARSCSTWRRTSGSASSPPSASGSASTPWPPARSIRR
ncbi:hypothetical protein [Streptomyces lunaelactis]|uniref:hypothetical protein n=1 Tax=Streptomyces lunaelactis TaxID=1535768 RepID=UPI00211D9B27|nr:hypothetical protein [Streptomyces lunaelactis]